MWQLPCSFLPGPAGIERKLGRLATATYRTDRDEPLVLHQGGVYLAEIEEVLELPPGVWGRTNPKSSTGRLDVFVRVLTEHGYAFDTIPEGYRGRLFLELRDRRTGDHGQRQQGDESRVHPRCEAGRGTGVLLAAFDPTCAEEKDRRQLDPGRVGLARRLDVLVEGRTLGDPLEGGVVAALRPDVQAGQPVSPQLRKAHNILFEDVSRGRVTTHALQPGKALTGRFENRQPVVEVHVEGVTVGHEELGDPVSGHGHRRVEVVDAHSGTTGRARHATGGTAPRNRIRLYFATHVLGAYEIESHLTRES